MTFYVEEEVELFPVGTNGSEAEKFVIEEVAGQVMEAVLEAANCPYEAQVNLLLTDNRRIAYYNNEFRNIDAPTDVLSFPVVPFRRTGGFAIAEEEPSCFDPESGELLLGDIIISVEKIRGQAVDYGHSIKREFAFLLAHGMFHLCGYDHMLPREAMHMEKQQERILTRLGIIRV